MKQNFFAVDLGATSGRTILGSFIEGGLNLEEINRFPNHLIEVGGHFYWDIYALYRHIIDGLKLVAHRGESIASIGIDTWGVDFVLLGKDGNLLRQPYAYRDPHTVGAPEAFFSRISRSEVYGKTGIQVMNFNSLFQLDTLRRNHDSALEAADKVLFMPDALKRHADREDGNRIYHCFHCPISECTYATSGTGVAESSRTERREFRSFRLPG